LQHDRPVSGPVSCRDHRVAPRVGVGGTGTGVRAVGSARRSLFPAAPRKAAASLPEVTATTSPFAEVAVAAIAGGKRVLSRRLWIPYTKSGIGSIIGVSAFRSDYKGKPVLITLPSLVPIQSPQMYCLHLAKM
jgi:hypothetical protein